MLNTEQFAATQKANLEVLRGMTAMAFEGVEQITALNLQTAKASFDEVSEASLAALSAKDPQALLALQTALMQPASEKVTAYGRQLMSILTASKAEFDKAASAQAAAAQKSVVSAFEAAAKNAPEGSGSGVALFKSALATANNAFDSLQKASRQATEAAEANFSAVTNAVVAKPAKAKRG